MHQLLQAVISSKPFVYLRHRRIARVFASILPSPEMNHLWVARGDVRHGPHKLTLLERSPWFVVLRLVAMDALHKFVIIGS